MAKKLKKKNLVKNDMGVEEMVMTESSTQNKSKFPKKVILFLIAVLILVGIALLIKKYSFVASVNGQLINRLAVIKELEKQGGQKVLDTIVLKTLIGQEAKKRKVTITEKDVANEVAKIEKNVTSQGTTLDALLKQQGMTKKDLEGELKLQLLVNKMVGDIPVSEKEIDDYLASQKEQAASLDTTEPAPEITRDEAKNTLKQQKSQQKIQTFIADLKANAKINYLFKY